VHSLIYITFEDPVQQLGIRIITVTLVTITAAKKCINAAAVYRLMVANIDMNNRINE